MTTAPQPLDAPLTRHATFLVLSLTRKPTALRTVRLVLASLSDLLKNVAFRDPGCTLTCTAGIGSAIWDQLTHLPRPRELRPFAEVKGQVHTAISTPGDIFLHIRSDRRDLAFEFERQLLNKLHDSVSVNDETVGFRYFDTRDLLGFVDGTANPVGSAVPESTLVTTQDDSVGAGGSYVVVQKYVHDLAGWSKLSAEQQEAVIGRTKLDNTELDDAQSGQKSHKTLTTIEAENGEEMEIMRDNMPFGSATGESGTYFIAYTRRLWVIERMMEKMFVGDPPGLHDRILDFSRPTSGSTFFVPPMDVLEGLEEIE